MLLMFIDLNNFEEAGRESIEDEDNSGESNEDDDNCGETFDEVPRVLTYGQEVLLSTERVDLNVLLPLFLQTRY